VLKLEIMDTKKIETILYYFAATLVIGGALIKMFHLADNSIGQVLKTIGFLVGFIALVITSLRMKKLEKRNKELEARIKELEG